MNDKTLALLARALEADPADWETRAHLAALHLEAGQPAKARALVEQGPVSTDNETDTLAAARSLLGADGDAALALIDRILAANKACAAAHFLKAMHFRNRDDRATASKHYNVAVVIDDALEDPDFESWLDGKPSHPPKSVPVAAQGGPVDPASEDDDDALTEEDYVETDAALDALFAGKASVRFDDVGGMDDLKERIRMKIIYPFKNEGLFSKFKKKGGGGLLLYGPPGCGKTLMARATAGECDAFFASVEIPDILSRWLGESEQRLHQIFEAARRRRPAVIFIDEVDALGIKRSEASGGIGSLVNVLLTEIDGAASNNEDILVIGATNTPWRVDNAFRRPGRFDKVLFVPPPDLEARRSILGILLRELPADGLDIDKLARATDRYSGADLRAIVDAAVESAIAQEMRGAKDVRLTQKMLAAAIKDTRRTTLEWLEQATNYASYANQSGLYDELSAYLNGKH